MKKNIVLTSIFALYIFSTTAQNLEWNTQPELYSEINFGISMPNGDWLLGGRANTPYLVKLDSLGAIKWGTTDFPGGRLGRVEEIIFDSDTSYIAIGGSTKENGDRSGFIRRHHIDGTSLSRIVELFGFSTSFPYIFQDIDLFDEQTILVHAFSSFHRKAMVISLEGIILWEGETSNFITDVLVLENNEFLVVENNPSIVKYNSDYSVDTTILLDEHIYQIEHYTDGQFISSTRSNIHILNQDFQIQKTFSHPEINSINHFYIYDNEIFLTGVNEDFIPFIIKLNENLEEEFYAVFGNEYMHASQVIVTENQIGIAGRANLLTPINPHLGSPPSSMFFKTFSKTGYSIDLKEDVSIEDLEVGSIIKPDPFLNQLEVKNIKVTVRNLGLDTLNTMKFIKPDNSIEKLFNLHILPNDSLRVGLSDFNFRDVVYFDDYKFCLSVSVPNQKLDVNPINNGMCKDIIVEKIPFEGTGIESIIFPNPVLNEIKLNATILSSDYDLTVVNSIGQEVIQDKYLYTIPLSSKRIDVSNLSHGVYFLILKNEEDYKIVSFVKK